MKKVIVTHENYEEIMFDLLENNYPADVRENILDQIHADTLLNFEWQQWSKAVYSESTEPYKTNEAEYIESLTRPEERKKGAVYYMWPVAIAASILLFTGIYLFYPSAEPLKNGMVQSRVPAAKHEADKATSDNEKQQATIFAGEEKIKSSHNDIQHQPTPVTDGIQIVQADNRQDTAMPVKEYVKQEQQNLPLLQDTVRRMIVSAQKKSRYKVTIIEGEAANPVQDDFSYIEKRYTMADVMKHTDGISLHKFLQNPKSRIVNDRSNNTVVIEYMAEDHSVLVLTLSN